MIENKNKNNSLQKNTKNITLLDSGNQKINKYFPKDSGNLKRRMVCENITLPGLLVRISNCVQTNHFDIHGFLVYNNICFSDLVTFLSNQVVSFSTDSMEARIQLNLQKFIHVFIVIVSKNGSIMAIFELNRNAVVSEQQKTMMSCFSLESYPMKFKYHYPIKIVFIACPGDYYLFRDSRILYFINLEMFLAAFRGFTVSRPFIRNVVMPPQTQKRRLRKFSSFKDTAETTIVNFNNVTMLLHYLRTKTPQYVSHVDTSVQVDSFIAPNIRNGKIAPPRRNLPKFKKMSPAEKKMNLQKFPKRELPPLVFKARRNSSYSMSYSELSDYDDDSSCVFSDYVCQSGRAKPSLVARTIFGKEKALAMESLVRDMPGVVDSVTNASDRITKIVDAITSGIKNHLGKVQIGVDITFFVVQFGNFAYDILSNDPNPVFFCSKLTVFIVNIVLYYVRVGTSIASIVTSDYDMHVGGVSGFAKRLKDIVSLPLDLFNKTFSAFLNIINLSQHASSFFERVHDQLPTCLQQVMEFIWPSLRVTERRMVEFLDVIEKGNAEMASNKPITAEVLEYLVSESAALQQLMAGVSKRSSVYAPFNTAYREAKVIIAYANCMKQRSAPRNCPYGVCFVGDSGVGKSTLLNSICHTLHRVDPAGSAYGTTLYIRSPGSETWDGFTPNTFAVAYDDFLQDREYEDASEVFNLISKSHYIPPMASLDSPAIGVKGTIVNCRVVCAATNMSNVSDLSSNFNKPEAIARRFKSCYLVTKRKDVDYDSSGEFKHLLFQEHCLYDDGNQNIEAKTKLTYLQVMTRIVADYIAHFESELKVNTMIEAPKEDFIVGIESELAKMFNGHKVQMYKNGNVSHPGNQSRIDSLDTSPNSNTASVTGSVAACVDTSNKNYTDYLSGTDATESEYDRMETIAKRTGDNDLLGLITRARSRTEKPKVDVDAIEVVKAPTTIKGLLSKIGNSSACAGIVQANDNASSKTTVRDCSVSRNQLLSKIFGKRNKEIQKNKKEVPYEEPIFFRKMRRLREMMSDAFSEKNHPLLLKVAIGVAGTALVGVLVGFIVKNVTRKEDIEEHFCAFVTYFNIPDYITAARKMYTADQLSSGKLKIIRSLRVLSKATGSNKLKFEKLLEDHEALIKERLKTASPQVKDLFQIFYGCEVAAPAVPLAKSKRTKPVVQSKPVSVKTMKKTVYKRQAALQKMSSSESESELLDSDVVKHEKFSKTHHEYNAQGAALSYSAPLGVGPIHELIARNIVFVKLLSSPNKPSRLDEFSLVGYLNGIAIKGKQILVPRHFIYHCIDGAPRYIYEDKSRVYTVAVHHGGVSFRVQLSESNIAFVKNSDGSLADAVILNLNCAAMQSFRDISGHFLRESDLKKIRMTMEGVLIGKRESEELTATPLDLNLITEATPYSDQDSSYVFNVALGFNYTVKSNYGDCGSALIISLPDRFAIAGIHVAGSSKKYSGMSNLLFREMLPLEERTIVRYDTDVEFKLQSARSELGLNLKVTKFDDPQFVSRKTEYVKSPVFGLLDTKHPSVKKGKPDPLVISACLYGSDDITPSYEFTNEIIESVARDFPVQEARLLDMYEALGKWQNMDGINIHTSAGYPWTGKKLNKSNLLNLDVLGNYTYDPEFEKYMATYIDKFKKDPVYPLWTVSMKDELLKPGKLCRTFEIPPLEFTILSRMYFGAWISSCMSVTHNFMCMCINPESADTTVMINDLKAQSHLFLNYDFANSEKVLPTKFFYDACKAVNLWYRNNDPNWKEEDDIVRLNIVECVCSGPMIVGNLLFFVFHGMKSGWALTLIFNTLIYYLLLVHAWYNLAPLPFRSYYHFSRLVTTRHVGDDGIATVSIECPWFNMCSIRDYYKTLGITITSADKTNDLKPYVSLKECEFLKRTFRAEGRIWKPMLASLSITSMVSYVRRGSVELESQYLCNVLTALQYAYFHGHAYYEALVKILQPSIGVVLPSYGYFDHLWCNEIYGDMPFVI